MGGIADAVGDFFDDALDAISGVVEDVLNNIVAPIAEAVFNALGFEDETIVNSYVSVSSLYGSESYVNPFHKIPINRVTFGTSVYDEIMNIFISGEHIRIKAMMKKVEGYGITPTSTIQITTIDEAAIKTIIDDIEGEAVTIINVRIGMPEKPQYIQEYLQNNEGTTGYTYDSSLKSLDDGTLHYLIGDAWYEFDATADAYDLTVMKDVTYEIQVPTATNQLAAPASTYGIVGGVVTLDTAVDASEPAQGDFDIFMENTESILQDVVPAQVNPGRQYQVTYTLDSDTSDAPTLYWWFYTLEVEPHTYPTLYPDDPVFPSAEKQVLLPIVPLKLDSTWLIDLDNAEWEQTNRSMRRYGIRAASISNKLIDDPNGNNDDITSVFFMFGVNIAKAVSQSEIDYMYNMFADYASIDPDLTAAGYLQLKSDLLFAKQWRGDSTYNGSGFRLGLLDLMWEIVAHDDRPRLMDLLAAHVNPIYETYDDLYQTDQLAASQFAESFHPRLLPQDDDVIGEALDPLIEALQALVNNNTTTYNITQGDFNVTISYGAVLSSLKAGDIGDGTVGNVSKQIVEANFQLFLRKQTAVNEYTEIEVLDFNAFSYIRQNASNTYLAILDFVGSDNEEINVKNNMVIPITYGYLLELGIVRRKELLYRAAQIQLFTIDVTKIRWYETESFQKFFSAVLKVIAIVVLVVSFGSGVNASTALWTAAKFYGTKLIAEYAIQQVLLANPDSAFAQALALGISIYAISATGGFQFESAIDTALEGIAAINQVSTQYTEIKSVELLKETKEFTEDAKEKDERLKQAIANQDIGSASLLEYVKETVTMRFTDPNLFLEKGLTRSLVDQALELDNFLDVQQLLDLEGLNREIT